MARKLRLKSCPFDRFSQWKKMLNKKHWVSITNFSNKTMDMTLLKTFSLLCCLISFVPSTQCLQPKQYNYNIENNVAGKMHSIFFIRGNHKISLPWGWIIKYIQFYNSLLQKICSVFLWEVIGGSTRMLYHNLINFQFFFI